MIPPELRAAAQAGHDRHTAAVKTAMRRLRETCGPTLVRALQTREERPTDRPDGCRSHFTGATAPCNLHGT